MKVFDHATRSCSQRQAHGSAAEHARHAIDYRWSQYAEQRRPIAWLKSRRRLPSRATSSAVCGVMGAPAAICSPTSYNVTYRSSAVARSSRRTMSSGMRRPYPLVWRHHRLAKVGCTHMPRGTCVAAALQRRMPSALEVASRSGCRMFCCQVLGIMARGRRRSGVLPRLGVLLG